MVLPSPWPCGGLLAFAASLAGALALDVLYPRHSGLALRLHPVHTSFVMARALAPPGSGLARGAVVAALVLAVHLAVWGALLWGSCALLGAAGYAAASAVVLKLSLGHRLLYDTVARAARALESGDLAGARVEVQGIVRRRTSQLGPGHVASAAVESLAENLVDAYVSPLFYAALLGPLGALAQRVANALDAALGYKTPAYSRAGAPAAHLDTALNYAPARLAGLLIALAAPAGGGSMARALRCMARFRGATESANAGYPISAMAGALGVRLEKPGSYRICPGKPLPGPGDVRAAVRIALAAAAAATALAAVVRAVLAA